jgi:hypothetical protein
MSQAGMKPVITVVKLSKTTFPLALFPPWKKGLKFLSLQPCTF